MIIRIPGPQSVPSGRHRSSLPQQAAATAAPIIAPTVMDLLAVLQPNWRQHICAERVQRVYGRLFSSRTWSYFQTAIFVGARDGAISMLVLCGVYRDGWLGVLPLMKRPIIAVLGAVACSPWGLSVMSSTLCTLVLWAWPDFCFCGVFECVFKGFLTLLLWLQCRNKSRCF